MRFDIAKIGYVAAILAGSAAAGAALTEPARADITGTLTCNVASGVGAIVASQRALSCTFHSNLGPTELYQGSITRVGVDIGVINGGTLVYQVLIAGQAVPGALAGGYVGPGFGVTLGTGGGLDGLVGGNGNSITLQPIAATTSSGLNVNAGVGALQLAYVGPAGPRMHRHHHRGFYRGYHRHHHHHM